MHKGRLYLVVAALVSNVVLKRLKNVEAAKVQLDAKAGRFALDAHDESQRAGREAVRKRQPRKPARKNQPTRLSIRTLVRCGRPCPL